MRRATLPALGLVVTLAGCDRLSQQPRYDAYEPSRLFNNGAALQAPPDDVIAYDAPDRTGPEPDQRQQGRPPLTLALLNRGQERFGIYCAPCHDLAGTGQGAIVRRGFPAPPSFHQPRLRQAASDYFVTVIGQGHGVMYSYADRVAPADRWAIAAYIRALQLSQDAPLAALSPAERAQLPGAEP